MNNPLIDIIPDHRRKQAYALIAAAVFVFGIWQVAQGDWKAFLVALAATFVPATAASNTLPGDPVVPTPRKRQHRRDGHR